MHVIQTLRKWGNGTGLRLPKEVLEAAHLSLNQELLVTIQGHSVVLTPTKRKSSLLETILLGVSPSVIGGELDWGDELGAEVYE